MAEKLRFYVADSLIYGLTVYDRKSQTPAFELGAEIKMPYHKAIHLAAQLNRADRHGVLFNSPEDCCD